MKFTLINALLYYLITIIVSTLPDIDLRLPLVKHRTITHSLIAVVFIYFLSYFIISKVHLPLFNIKLVIIASLSYSSHLFLDIFSKKGILLFYPFKKRIKIFIDPIILKIIILTLFVISFKMLFSS